MLIAGYILGQTLNPKTWVYVYPDISPSSGPRRDIRMGCKWQCKHDSAFRDYSLGSGSRGSMQGCMRVCRDMGFGFGDYFFCSELGGNNGVYGLGLKDTNMQVTSHLV